MAIATLGYPSRMAAVDALDADGKSTEEIARLTGMKVTTVRSVRSLARSARVVRRQRLVEEDFRQAIWFDRRVIDTLRPEADRRRVPVTELVRDLVSTIAEDGLVNAILEDAQ